MLPLPGAQRAIGIDPGMLKAHVRAAKCLCTLGQLSDARRQLSTAALLPNSSAMLSPELPVGWTAVPLPDGGCYYAHAACGLAQWEHPQTAFLTGIVRRLATAMAEGAAARERRAAADAKKAASQGSARSPPRNEK